MEGNNWNAQENLKSHLNPIRFWVLQRAQNLLKEPYEEEFQTVFQLGRMKEIGIQR